MSTDSYILSEINREKKYLENDSFQWKKALYLVYYVLCFGLSDDILVNQKPDYVIVAF